MPGALLALLATAGGCREGCPPGYLEVAGECQLAVGQPCREAADCLSEICMPIDGEHGFCTVRCSGGDDCPVDYNCFKSIGGLCMPENNGEECSDDGDCGSCRFCLDGHCADDPSCSPCAGDDDCGACRLCQDGKCQPVAGCQTCVSGLDCPPCHDCRQGQCVLQANCQRCSSNDDCPGCQRCSLGACEEIPGCSEQPCFNDADCPSKTRCLANSQLGFNTCLPVELPFGADCSLGGDATCASGVCIGSEDGGRTCSRPCLQDDDCPWPLGCYYGEDCRLACREPYSPPPGPACLRNLDCQPGQACVPWADTLAGTWQTRCRPREPCGLDDGRECQQALQCQSSTCVPAGYCGSACAGDLDCPAGLACDSITMPLEPGGAEADWPGCVPAGQVPFGVGEYCRADGSGCGGDGCLRLGDAGAWLCTVACQPGGLPCPDAFTCQPDQRLGGTHACLPALAAGQCSRDADCDAGQVCRFSGQLEQLACAEPVAGGAAAGQPCSGDEQCDHGLCSSFGWCSAPCQQDADCPEGFVCQPQYLSPGQGGQAVFFQLCRPGPGSLERCWREADCGDGETCRPLLWPGAGAPDGRCDVVGSGPGPGAACSGPAGCGQGVCSSEGICAVPCVTTADCPAGSECRPGGYRPPAGPEMQVLLCLPLDRQLGQPCPGGDADCAAGLFCFQPPGGQDAYCSKDCQQDGDCQQDVQLFCRDDGGGRLVCQLP